MALIYDIKFLRKVRNARARVANVYTDERITFHSIEGKALAEAVAEIDKAINQIQLRYNLDTKKGETKP